MFRKVLLLCCILYSCFVNRSMAQPAGERPVYTSKWGYLYREAGNNNDPMGVFSTEAPIYLLDSTNMQYKVQVSNGDIGFIDRQPLKKFMDGKKSAGEPAKYFYRGVEGYQCPHYYVQVSELRVREAPTTASIAVRRAPLNELLCIDYVPLYTDGWVYIGDHFHENPEYVQLKFLGSVLTYDKVLKDYLAVKGKDQEKELVQVGRLRELAWREEKNLKQALSYWKESYAAYGVENPKVDIDFELLLASKLDKKPDFEAYERKMKMLNLHFIWNGVALVDGEIKDAQMNQLKMQRVADIPDMPECGWEPRYFYKTPNLIVAFEENYKKKIVGTVYKLYFTDGEILALGDQRMDANYDERDFVHHFGDMISTNMVEEPHVYRFQNGDAGQLIITFKDGKLFRYDCMYYC
ncbi:hypothetical protein [Sphingobacterium sp. HMA12]|uniref:hypothetical protein n=1 Tax=Sphingobacterium sp. HMA12 TaxID=2050894 RepID=UPI00131591A8|nr:hypothetical protein [Sphingobacterium sp. HMA12]